jgi:hypothetical protein
LFRVSCCILVRALFEVNPVLKLFDFSNIKASNFKSPGIIVLILVNLIPVFGVLFLDWKVFPIIFLYWAENVIIGFFNVLKMAKASPESGNFKGSKASLITFFCFHYGIFAFVHGIFVFVLFGGIFQDNTGDPYLPSAFNSLDFFWILFGLLALFISHSVSFITNYLGRGEYKRASLNMLMFQPYTRVVILHVVILIGGFLLVMAGAPIAGLIILVAIKIGFDILGYLRRHAGGSTTDLNNSPD